jgi:hypothetical protein
MAIALTMITVKLVPSAKRQALTRILGDQNDLSV